MDDSIISASTSRLYVPRVRAGSKLSQLSEHSKASDCSRKELFKSAPDLSALGDTQPQPKLGITPLFQILGDSMAVVVELKSLDVVGGKQADRFCKLTFRDNVQKSKAISAKELTSFNQTFRWPVGRGVDAADLLSVKVYSKQITKSFYGVLNVSLQELANAPDGRVQLRESLVDANHSLLPATIELEIIYYRPDSNVYVATEEDEQLLEEAAHETKSIFGTLSGKLAAKFRRDTTGGSKDADASSVHSACEDDINEHIRNVFKYRELKCLAHCDPTIHHAEDFQLQLTIIEARQLNGVNLNPYIEVLIGEESKQTDVQFGTNAPSFNEYFCFDFNMPRSQVLDQVLQLRAYSKGTNMIAKLLGGKLIGEFRMDLKTVWNAPDHMLFSKWALLIDPHDASGGSRGYVKMHCYLLSKGETTKSHAPPPVDPNKPPDTLEEIEANLLVSSTPSSTAMQKRQLAEITVKIYRAQDLPRMNTDLVAKMRNTLLGSDRPMLDSFVSVSYSGHSAETRTKKGSYQPVWNEEIVFTDLFPPLCNRVRISVMDSIAVGKNECVGTHYIDLAQIMDAGQRGYLPTFGPNWVNLYGCPRQYTYEHWLGFDEELNKGLGDGVSYRGRLLVALKTKLLGEAQQIEAKTRPTPPLNDSVLGAKEDYLLFGAIYEANVIDAEIGGKKTPLRFELSCGMYGNRIDTGGQATHEQLEAGGLECRSYTSPMVPLTIDKQYYHLPIENRKECMYVRVQFEENRARMLTANALSRMHEFLEWKIDELLASFRSGQELSETIKSLKSAARVFARLVERVLQNFEELRGIGVRTLLDKERNRVMNVTLEKLKAKAKQIYKSKFDSDDREGVNQRLKEMKSVLPIIGDLLSEPQHSLPDVFLWLLGGENRLAYVRIPARDLLYAEKEDQRGRMCGHVCTLFMRKPGRAGTGKSGWAIQAQVKAYLWMGHVRHIATLKDGLPANFHLVPDPSGLPREVVYREKSMFQLRAYIYLARNLIGSDETGLSDPFARVIMRDKVITSRIVNETLNPIWDQTLVLDKLLFHSSAAWIRDNRPVVVIEIFDHDDDGDTEFLGRTLVTPAPVMHTDGDYTVPGLKWSEVYRNQKHAGELLAAFELIELKDGDYQFPSCYPPRMMRLKSAAPSDDDEHSPYHRSTADLTAPDIIPIPQQIRPVLAKYRLQVLFWGVRSMKKVQYTAVDSPRVELEWSGYFVKSTTIQSVEKCPNFSEPVTYIDLELPENSVYWPPITIRCFENRQFGRQLFVGSHVISSLTKYVHEEEKEPKGKEKKKKKKNRKKMQKASSTGQINANQESMYGEHEQAIEEDEDEDADEEIDVDKMLADGPAIHSPPPRFSVVDETSTEHKAEPGNEDNQKSAEKPSQDDQNNETAGATDPLTAAATQSAAAAAPGEPAAAAPIVKPKVRNAGMNIADMAGALVGVAGGHKISKPGKAIPDEVTKFKQHAASKPDKKELDEVDWWSRYYAAIEMMLGETAEGDLENLAAALFSADEDCDDMSCYDAEKLLEGIEVDVKTLDDTPILDAPDADEVEGKKKKRRKRRKKTNRREAFKKRLAAKNAATQFRREILGEDEEEEDTVAKDVKSWIEKLIIYPCSLEMVPEFGSFTAFLHTYPFLFGKASEEDGDDNEQECVGELKGNLRIARIANEEYGRPVSQHNLSLGRCLPHNACLNVVVRVYVVRGIDLAPADPNGKSDPYLIVQLGSSDKKVQNDREHYIPVNLNPVFGKCFEFEAVFPQESLLTVTVMDFDLLSGDDEIGQTKIDLENRLLSKHNATCGLASAYEIAGYNKWRDTQTPCQILHRMCSENDLPLPVYDPANYRVAIGDKMFYGPSQIEDEHGKTKSSNEPLALAALRKFQTVEGGRKLVPEHVETRSLYTEERPGIEQGRVEMWVDLFVKEMGTPPPAIDVSPRQPKKFQLRVTIWNTDDVILNDTSVLTGEKSSDIYVKGWLNGADIDCQSTDIHYRSMTGEGNFNWRFVYDIGFMPAEDRIVIKKKESPLALDEIEIKKHPILYLQVWDADLIGSDNFLGTLELRLSKYPRPSKVARSSGLHQFAKEVPQMNIFKQKRCKGWWPFVNKNEETNEDEVTGKVEAEIHLLTAEEAEGSPAGLGRSEPDPLPPPNRPEASIFSFLNPCKVIKHLLYTYRWLLCKVFTLLFLVLFILLLFYTAPGAITTKLIG